MAYKGKFVAYKAIGWVGYSEGKPWYEATYDDYVGVDGRPETPIDVTNVFKSRKEARHRFQDVRRVFVEVK